MGSSPQQDGMTWPGISVKRAAHFLSIFPRPDTYAYETMFVHVGMANYIFQLILI